MTKRTENNGTPDQRRHPSHRLRLPGFITGEEIGLGDLIRQATAYAGIKPCTACERRAAALNRWMVFDGRTK